MGMLVLVTVVLIMEGVTVEATVEAAAVEAVAAAAVVVVVAAVVAVEAAAVVEVEVDSHPRVGEATMATAPAMAMAMAMVRVPKPHLQMVPLLLGPPPLVLREVPVVVTKQQVRKVWQMLHQNQAVSRVLSTIMIVPAARLTLSQL